jgi:hypothetical protein
LGGKAVPTHPDYLTRGQAAQEISKAITGKPNDQLGDIVYRRIGEYQRSGKLKSEPIASGRTKQFHKRELHSFALQVFDIDVDAFKLDETSTNNDVQNKQNILNEDFEKAVNQGSNSTPTLLTDIRSIIHLHDRKLLDDRKAISMIKKLVSESIIEEEN